MQHLADDMLGRLDEEVCDALRLVRDRKGVKATITLTLAVERLEDTDGIEVAYKIKGTHLDTAASAAGSVINGTFRLPGPQLTLKDLREGQ